MKKPVWLDRADCLAIHDLMRPSRRMAGVRAKAAGSASIQPRNLLAYRSPRYRTGCQLRLRHHYESPV